jgi:hypothetical protein
VPDSRDEPAILHIHSQRYPHDTVEIFGTSAGLERLVNALIDALNVGRGSCEFVVSDGFEADAQIACLDGRRRGEEWRRSGSPYLDIEDPLVARIIELSDDNARLRQTLNTLRSARPPGLNVDGRGRGV